MPNLYGTKWGDPAIGTTGGVVTWSIADGGENINDFFSRYYYEMNSRDPGRFLRFNYEKVIENAFAEWAKYGNIQFQQVPDGGGAAGSQDDGDIRIFFGPLPGRTLGLGAFPHPTNPIGGDILLDVRTSYNTNREMFRALVLHEIGHALGLDHVSRNSIMTPVLGLTRLQRDDRDAMRQLYGDPDIAPSLYIKGAGVYRLAAKNNDLIAQGNGRKNIIVGTSGNDTIDGGANNDRLIGGVGADELRGGTGNDILIGKAGADLMDGGEGFDTADYRSSAKGIVLDMLQPAGTGGDATGDVLSNIEKIIGSKSADTILADDNDNRIVSLHGWDLVDGRGGDDFISGFNGNDTLRGGTGDDTLHGEAGNDLLEGGADNDVIIGARGNDTLEGGDGDDVVRGGGNNDVIEGGAGNDDLKGNRNADVFIFADGHGNDTIGDFSTRGTAEVIDLSGVTALGDFADVLAASADTIDGLLIDTGGGDSILLNNISLNKLSADDFLF
ncbi:matrixin family metalloprotease [Roseovarius sp. CAU 1744]|uniref:matrixin family metalloprotease n=1 Tax=Roseovarius sp. CAU 1744 TaxID=3140368 RepID=UPI00325AD161